ncbi:SpoIIE family protein phosphatase [Pelagicoccus sp. SDUM812005]|uniref:SpoIIE family protein phosphatase n=1 Tax=Pelagicoccus sp. SDUM812005 TaxID=3041257 RepID=UPI00280F76FB|nr:SpoIIE family protein phosphatase [Pelagicoccus sp. SDUM812005]MDQ8180542.1 SpoIIE family protein phosphatase [Pelagicoccus sp. SDUM812005]
MFPDSDNHSYPKSLSTTFLGTSPDASPEQEGSFTRAQLKAALEAAYQAGADRAKKQEKHTADPDMLFWQLMDNLPDNVYFKDTRSRFICVNRAQARFLGVEEPNDAIGLSDFDFFPEKLAKIQFQEEQEIIATGKGYSLHEEKHLKDDVLERFIVSSKLPLKDSAGKVYGTFGISRDVTERYLAEREVQRQRNLLEAIIDILPCRIFVRDLDDRFVLANQTYKTALGIKSSQEIIGHTLAEFSDEERVAKIKAEDQRVREKGEPILNQIDFDLSVFKKDSWIVTSKVPLRGSDGSIEGIVGMTYDITEQKLAEEEARTLSEKLRHKNAQFEAELLVARQLQETLMSIGFDENRQYSKSGTNWDLRSSYFYKPSHHLAGDFFDLIQISDSKVGVLVCDVMGHGVKAALVTMLLRGLISEFADILDQPGRVLGQLNKRLCSLAEDQEFPRFTTAVYLTLDLDTGQARVANAGHPGPLWKTRDQHGRELFEPCPSGEIGPALGLIPEQEFPRHEFTCQDTTEFLLYTDGIIEQKDAMGNEFGILKLEELLLNNKGDDLAEQLKTIKSALKLTAGTEDFDDDICIVAVKMQPKAPKTGA